MTSTPPTPPFAPASALASEPVASSELEPEPVVPASTVSGSSTPEPAAVPEYATESSSLGGGVLTESAPAPAMTGGRGRSLFVIGVVVVLVAGAIGYFVLRGGPSALDQKASATSLYEKLYGDPPKGSKEVPSGFQFIETRDQGRSGQAVGILQAIYKGPDDANVINIDVFDTAAHAQTLFKGGGLPKDFKSTGKFSSGISDPQVVCQTSHHTSGGQNDIDVSRSDCLALVGNVVIDAVSAKKSDPKAGNNQNAIKLVKAGIAYVERVRGG